MRLPFDEETVEPLREVDPLPQRVPQYPSHGRKPTAEEAIPTAVFDVEEHERQLEGLGEGYSPAFLFVDRGPGAGQLISIKQGVLVIGRASVSDLRIQHGSVSRRHAQLTRKGERFYVKDLGSQNGTWVNRQRIPTELELFPGDQIAVGNTLLKLRGPKEQAAALARGEGARRVSSKEVKRRKRSAGLMRVALFGGAVGFGLAGVLLFAFFKLPRRPSFTDIAAPGREQGTSDKASAAAKPSTEDVISARIQEVMEERARQAPPPVPPALPERESEPEAAPERKAPSVAEQRAEREATLALYVEGDVAGALARAKGSGDEALEHRLASFQERFTKAQAALQANDGTAAITHYRAALAVDKRLGLAQSRPGQEVREALAKLSLLAAAQFLRSGDNRNAERWFIAALGYEPNNAEAKNELDALRKAKAPAKAATEAESEEESEEKSTPTADPARPKRYSKPASAAERPSRADLEDAFNL